VIGISEEPEEGRWGAGVEGLDGGAGISRICLVPADLKPEHQSFPCQQLLQALCPLLNRTSPSLRLKISYA
jgi:hypothetical protein